jgi:hypothetical protein
MATIFPRAMFDASPLSFRRGGVPRSKHVTPSVSGRYDRALAARAANRSKTIIFERKAGFMALLFDRRRR